MLGLYVLGFARGLRHGAAPEVVRPEERRSAVPPRDAALPAAHARARSRLRMYDRAKIFLRRAGTVILGVAIVLWILAHLPLHGGQDARRSRTASRARSAARSSRS